MQQQVIYDTEVVKLLGTYYPPDLIRPHFNSN